MKKVPFVPTNEMLVAGYNALSKIYPSKDNNGHAVGHYIVWQSMYEAYSPGTLDKSYGNVIRGLIAGFCFICIMLISVFSILYYNDHNIPLAVCGVFAAIGLWIWTDLLPVIRGER